MLNARKKWTTDEETIFMLRYQELKDKSTSDMEICEVLAEEFGRTPSALFQKLHLLKTAEKRPPATIEQVKGFIDFIFAENEALKNEILELKHQISKFEQMEKDYEMLIAIMDRARKDALGINDNKKFKIDGNGVVESYES